MTRSAILFVLLPSLLLVSAPRLKTLPASQAAVAGQVASAASLKPIGAGHYLYSMLNGSRIFNSGVIVTDEGAVVVDALDSEAIARGQRAAFSSTIKQPVRYLLSSSFHDPYSKGNTGYRDVFKVGHENYRAGLVEQMTRGAAPADEQRARRPTETFRDRATLYVGGKEIQLLHFGPAHTRGDSIVFVPADRIAYLSEVFFADEFPNIAQGYGVSWLRALDAIEALPADIFVPGHGPIPADPKGTRASLHAMRQILVDARDAVQKETARGATEDQAAAAVKRQPYEKLASYGGQREVMVRRIY